MSQECVELIQRSLHYVVRGLSAELAFKRAVRETRRVEDCYQYYLGVLRSFHQVNKLYPARSLREKIEEAMRLDPEPRLALPKWMLDRLLPLLGEEGLRGIFRRNWWARVNELRTSIEDALKDLRDRGVEFTRDQEFPFLLRFSRSPSRLPQVKEGTLIPQDRASVLSVSVLDPKPGETILELGSSPGVKTSLIQQITRNTARVIAVDVSRERIEVQKGLMRRWGVENVDLVNADAINFWVRRADKVFIDAPCSNSGTVNVDPSIPLRLRREDLVRLRRLQARILERVSQLRIPTVYVTCSLFPEEGEFQVERYRDYLVPVLKGHPGYRRSKVWLRVARTYPHLDGSEGFFIAKLDFTR